MKYALALLPLLASAASAQDDVWKNLNKGDRVQVTFRSGNMILGNLSNKPGDPRVTPGPVDYSTANEVTLDLSLEYPGLNGTMTIPRKEIKEIRKLQSLDAATMKRIQEEMKRIQAQAAKDDEERRLREQERDKAKEKDRIRADKEAKEAAKEKETGAKLLKEFEELQKGKELLRRFPPDKYNPNLVKDIADMAIRKQPVPPDLKEYTDPENLRLWLLALNAQKETEAAEKKEKEKAAEEKK